MEYLRPLFEMPWGTLAWLILGELSATLAYLTYLLSKKEIVRDAFGGLAVTAFIVCFMTMLPGYVYVTTQIRMQVAYIFLGLGIIGIIGTMVIENRLMANTKLAFFATFIFIALVGIALILVAQQLNMASTASVPMLAGLWILPPDLKKTLGRISKTITLALTTFVAAVIGTIAAAAIYTSGIPVIDMYLRTVTMLIGVFILNLGCWLLPKDDSDEERLVGLYIILIGLAVLAVALVLNIQGFSSPINIAFLN